MGIRKDDDNVINNGMKNFNIINDTKDNNNLNENEKIKDDDYMYNDILETNIVIRMQVDHKKILKKHFNKHRGISLSGGIRELIFNYMRENKLI